MTKEASNVPKVPLSFLIKQKEKLVAKIKQNYNTIKFSHTKREKINNFEEYVTNLVIEQSKLRAELIKIKCIIQKENYAVFPEIYALSEFKTELAELKYLTDAKYSERISEINKEILRINELLEKHNQKLIPFWVLK